MQLGGRDSFTRDRHRSETRLAILITSLSYRIFILLTKWTLDFILACS